MLTPGSILQNHYQIIRQLGAGGMSTVYLVYDLHLGNRLVVIKENQGSATHRFQQEAILLANLSHSNLPRVTDHFVTSSGQYLVMDYIEGQDLNSIVERQGRLSENVALGWLRQILAAVEYIHANGIIHRDIKPQNVIITSQGRAILVDFGIAKVMTSGQSSFTGARAGTPGYSPPEQYAGGTTEHSDVYALGATLYFLLTARIPTESPSRSAGIELIPPRQIDNTISPQIEVVTLTAMNLNARRRYASVKAMRQALESSPQPLAQSPPQFAPSVISRAHPAPTVSRTSGSASIASPVMTIPQRKSERNLVALVPIGLAVAVLCAILTIGLVCQAVPPFPPFFTPTRTTTQARSTQTPSVPVVVMTIPPLTHTLTSTTTGTPTHTRTPASTVTRTPTLTVTHTPTSTPTVPTPTYTRTNTSTPIPASPTPTTRTPEPQEFEPPAQEPSAQEPPAQEPPAPQPPAPPEPPKPPP